MGWSEIIIIRKVVDFCLFAFWCKHYTILCHGENHDDNAKIVVITLWLLVHLEVNM